jgi:hypothetical protein
MAAALVVKSPLAVTIERLLREFWAIVKAVYGKVKNLFSRDSSPDPSADGTPGTPQNILINSAATLHKFSTWLTGRKNVKVRKIGAFIGRISNRLSRPNFDDPILSFEELALEVLRWLMAVGSIVFERLMARYSTLGATLVLLVDAILSFLSGEGVEGAQSALVNLCINFLLLVIPLWLSLPIHFLYDVLQTGLLPRITKVMDYIQHVRGRYRQWRAAKRTLDDFGTRLETEDFSLSQSDGTLMREESNRPFSLRPLWDSTIECYVKNPPSGFADMSESGSYTVGQLYRMAVTRNPNLENETLFPRVGTVSLIADEKEFQNVGLTTNKFETYLSAMALRYSKLPKEPDRTKPILANYRHRFHTVLRGGDDGENIDTRSEHMVAYPRMLKEEWRPLSVEEFKEHIKDFPRGKKLAYEKRAEAWLAGTIEVAKDVQTAPADGKHGEHLKMRVKAGEVYVKGRVVMYFKPDQHFVGEHPLILDALGFKKYLISLYNSTIIKRDGYIFSFFTPSKGTPKELDDRVALLQENEILYFFSGDDGHYQVKKNGEIRTFSNDAKRCEFTILGSLQKETGKDFNLLGLRPASWNRVLQANSAPSAYKVPGVDGLPTKTSIVQDAGITNKSGQAMTTILTMHTMFRNGVRAADRWNGKLYDFPTIVNQVAVEVGMELEFEKNDRVRADGMSWAPAGMDSFLAHVCVKRGNEWNFIPLSYTKTCLIKGVNPVHKGQDLAIGIAARSYIPSLMSTPRGQAIRSAFNRYWREHLEDQTEPLEVYKEWISRDHTSKYKLAMTALEIPLTVSEEIKFLSRFGVTPEEYAIELSSWENVVDFPAHGHFPVSARMARAHYGYSELDFEVDG